MKKMLKNPCFTEKIIKSESIEKNKAYNELCEDILYIEKMNNILINYDIAGLSDIEDSLTQLDNFYNFDISKIENLDTEELENLKEYQKKYKEIAGGEKYAEKSL